MANCIDYNCTDDLGTHTLNTCGEELLGGIDAAIFLECNHQLTNPSSSAQISAEIAAGRARLVKNIKASLPKRSVIEVESNVACKSPVPVNYDNTGTLIDGNVNTNNITFYQSLYAGHILGGIIFHMCGTAQSDSGEKVLWIDEAISFSGGLVVPDNNNAFQNFDGDFKWRSKDIPQLYDNPVSIFV